LAVAAGSVYAASATSSDNNRKDFAGINGDAVLEPQSAATASGAGKTVFRAA
jgi:hypothetical protein